MNILQLNIALHYKNKRRYNEVVMPIEDEISHISPQTEGDVYGLLIRLVKQLKFHLADRKTLPIGDL